MYVGHTIQQIYAAMENKKEYHQESIIEMEDKIYDRFVSIFIDLGLNYNYVNAELVDKCGLRKEVHVEIWLVHLTTSAKKRVHH